MERTKGGRGHKLPYDTESIRVASPMRDLLLELDQDYRDTLVIPERCTGLIQRIRELQSKVGQKGYQKNSAARLISELMELTMD